MTDLLTADQMRAVEEAAMDSGKVTGLELMERAGRGVVDAIFKEWPDLTQGTRHAIVFCGPGNNGGDGFVVARLLKSHGWSVDVFLYGHAEKLPSDARSNFDAWRELGEVGTVEQFRNRGGTWSADLIVDALFGTGLSRPIEDLTDILFNIDDAADLNADPQTDLTHFDAPRVVAIDIPSGLCSDSGRPLTPPHNGHAAASANLTVTFHDAKRGHFLSDGPALCGKLETVSIGLEGSSLQPREPVTLAAPNIHDLQKSNDTHKYSHGHALILSGGPGKTGAARLAARGALRIGAGLVTVGCPQNALAEIAHHQTAVMCKPLDGAPGLREMLEDERLNALCLGPGMGLGPDTQTMVLEALKATSADAGGPGSRPRRDAPMPEKQHAPANEPGPRSAPRNPHKKRAIVLDADALTRFERNPDILFDALHEGCVLTPHGGEFKRLFPDIAERLGAPATSGPAYSKVDATRDAAARAGCTILFKGPDTVIADQTGRCSINASVYDRAAPWLATAGSGDVLAGFVTGLLARGFPTREAAETAAWLHTECALSFGPGLIAEDLPEELPQVFRRLFDRN